MPNAFIYARVSTEEQAKEGQSIESQLRICDQYAKEHNLEIAGKYVDEGKSATNMNRPALQDMLTNIRSKEQKIEAILVQDTDRLARNTIDHLQIKAILKKHNTRLISISQPILDDSPEGNLVDTLLAATNAFSSQITGRKTSKVMEQKAMIGWYPGGVPPLGYQNADNPHPTSSLDRRIIVQDSSVAPLIKQTFEMYATGNYSTAQIAQHLNELQVQPRYGRKIHTSLVVNNFSNPFYIGKFRWKGREYQGKHEPLVSEELFQQVRSIMTDHNKAATRKRKHDFLLRGLLFCNTCHAQLWGEKHVRDQKEYAHYYCKNCGKGSYITQSAIEKQIERCMENIEISHAYIKKVLALAATMIEESRATRDSERRRLEKEKNTYDKALREAEDDRFIHHTITSEDFNRLTDRYRTSLTIVKSQLENLDTDHSEKLKILEKILLLAENIGTTYKIANQKMKREYLLTFFKKFFVNEGNIQKYEFTTDLKDLIEEGSVRVTPTGLPGMDSDHEPRS